MNHEPTFILSTKILDEAIIKQAASENIMIDCVPFIQINPIDTPLVQQKIADAIEANNNVIFTSANAVTAVAHQLQSKPGLRVFCISGKTKDAVKEYFSDSIIIEDAAYGADLAKKIIQHKIESAVFFCGNKRLDTIPDALRENNIFVNEIVVYETLSAPQKIEKHYDGILFFSPSAVESFFSATTIGEAVNCFAVGTTTAKVLKQYHSKIFISKNPTQASVLQTIIEQYKN